MKKYMSRKLGLALTAGILGTSLGAQDIYINELRINEPGSDVNEYFELKGPPGASLDGYWYLVIGDHSNFTSNEENPPDYRSGTVEFAVDLTGFSIGDDGLFLAAETTITTGAGLAGIDFPIPDIIFENSENVTHVLVTGYTGIEVTTPDDQVGSKGVDIDPNDDLTLVSPLPWDTTIDAVGVMGTPNDVVSIANGEEFVYGELLGFVNVGPDGSFAPGQIYRGANDNEWNIGAFSLDGGTDTPGLENLNSPTEPILDFMTPRTAKVGDTISVEGRNFNTVSEVTVNGFSATFFVTDNSTMTFIVPAGAATGPVVITNDTDSLAAGDLTVLDDSVEIVLYEDFANSLGDFIPVNVSSNADWTWGSFDGNGFAEMSGFGADAASDDWLISPAIDLSSASSPILEFQTARDFSGPALEVLISSDFNGINPTAATWTALSATLAPDNSDYTITDSGPVDLSAYVGETVYVAFRYTSEGPGSGEGATDQVHDFLVTDTGAPFAPGLYDLAVVGETYLFSEAWGFHETMGIVYVAKFPWVWQENYGWFYLTDGDIETGLWFYSSSLGWLYTYRNLNGMFLYSDGGYDSFTGF